MGTMQLLASRLRNCLAGPKESLRRLLERCGIILPPEEAARENFLRKYSEACQQFGIRPDQLHTINTYVKQRLPKEIAYAEEQGMQIPAARLEEMLTLHESAWRGYENYVRFLLYYGADPNSRDSEGSVPLWIAMKGGYKVVIKLLIDNGATLFSGDIGQFARHAVDHSNVDMLKEMTLYGVDIMKINIDGDTVLNVACEWDRYNVVQFLLDQGADGPPGKDAGEYAYEKYIQNEKAHDEKYPDNIFCDGYRWAEYAKTYYKKYPEKRVSDGYPW